MQRLAAFCDDSLLWLKSNLTDLDGRVFIADWSFDPADRGSDARDELASAERLGDVIVGAQIEGQHLLFFLVAYGEHEDRQPGSEAANAAQRFHSADARHIHIEQDCIVDGGAEHLQRLLSA